MASESTGLKDADNVEIEIVSSCSEEIELDVPPLEPPSKLAPLWPLIGLAYESIGVVYGDIGTSPLYVYSTTFGNLDGGLTDQRDIIGILSLIIWTLTLSPLVKYCLIVLFCDDNGEGGTFALYSLLCRHANISKVKHLSRSLSQFKHSLQRDDRPFSSWLKNVLERSKALKVSILAFVLLATCFVIGDGALTPAQSVLSAIGGIQYVKSNLSQDVVVGVSCAVLIVLFVGQRFGTSKLGFMFAPIVILWLLSIACVGVWNLFRYEAWFVFKAFSPHYGIDFLLRYKKTGWIALGGVFLAITGSEAMFADMGHFSRQAVQAGFVFFVYPCLMLAYIGQAAWLTQPENAANVSSTFFKSIPQSPGLYWPIFLIATAAAMVASQAMISATFSIVSQSMSLGCFPRVKVLHTSEGVKGQIFIPEVNAILFILTILITAIMGSEGTTTIANAYGIAVSGTMMITTFMTVLVLIIVKKWSIVFWAPFLLIFFVFDGVYLSSNLYKIPNGGWVPLVIAAVFIAVMATWQYGAAKKVEYSLENKLSIDWLTAFLSQDRIARIPGIGIFYSELPSGVPPIFAHFISSVPSVHRVVIFYTVQNVEVPRVLPEERYSFRRVGNLEQRMFRCVASFGYNESFGKKKNGLEATQDMVTALVAYIQSEDPILWTTQGQSSTDNSPDRENGDEGFHQDSIEVKKIKDDEVDVLLKANDMAPVHILGQVRMRARADSLVKKAVIDHGYWYLKAFSRQPGDTLNIPIQNLLEVGMQYEV